MAESNESEGLSELDELLVAALGEGRTYAAGAEVGGVSAKTVQRRMANPRFARAVGDRRRERVRELAALLMGASQRAVQVLVDVLEHGERVEQLRAAQMVLEFSRRYQREHAEDDDLVLRVRVLEELASEMQNDDRRHDGM